MHINLIRPINYIQGPPEIVWIIPPPITIACGSLSQAALTEPDPVKRKKLQDLLHLVQGLMHKIQHIPSAGIREMLFSKLAQVLQAAAGGDVDGALKMAGDLNTLVDKCAERCERGRLRPPGAENTRRGVSGQLAVL